MLASADRTILLSSLGWVDHDSLWHFDVPAGRVDRVPLESGARYVSLHAAAPDRFVVAHHFDGRRFELSVRTFADPTDVLARATIDADERTVTGDASAWAGAPDVYVEYLSVSPWRDHVLVALDPSARTIDVQALAWYDTRYDKDYQGVVDAIRLAGERVALVSIQRSSELVVHDLASGAGVGRIALAGRAGNPALRYRPGTREIWASDYDTIAVIDGARRRVVRKKRLQSAAAGTQQFIGTYSFAPDGTRCVVARPFSADVVELACDSLRIERTAAVGRQPFDAMTVGDDRVVARDWKTGDALVGTLTRRRRFFW